MKKCHSLYSKIVCSYFEFSAVAKGMLVNKLIKLLISEESSIKFHLVGEFLLRKENFGPYKLSNPRKLLKRNP